MTIPAHATEHNELLQLLGKATDKSQLIGAVVLITVGIDGRPMVGSNLGHEDEVYYLLRRLVAAEDQIAAVDKVDVPRDN